MFATVYAAVLTAAFFYVLLPLVGAMTVRLHWRSFRAAVKDASVWPELEPDSPDGSLARMAGKVDALEGRNLLWVRSERTVAVAPMEGMPVYMLLGAESGPDGEYMERKSWNSQRSINPWGRAFVAGRIGIAGGRKGFIPQDPQPIVILHDGDGKNLLERVVRRGRHANEYWNPLTQVSLATGVVAMSGIVSASLATNAPVLARSLVLTAALAPLLPLLPPGIVLFFAYRFYWRRGRECRARRDVASFRNRPRSYRAWLRLSALWTGVSILCFAGAFGVNAWLAFIILAQIL